MYALDSLNNAVKAPGKDIVTNTIDVNGGVILEAGEVEEMTVTSIPLLGGQRTHWLILLKGILGGYY